MIALKPRFLLLAAFCTFAAVQVTAVPLDERALSRVHHNSTGDSSTTHSRHATNGTSDKHKHESAAAADKRRKGRKHHGRQMNIELEASSSDSYQVSPRDPHDRHHHHHHHDKKDAGQIIARDPRHHRHHHDDDDREVVVEGADAHVHVHRREIESHHRDHDERHHRHHSRTEYSVYVQSKSSEAPEKAWDPLDPLIQIGSTEISDGNGPTYANTHPILRRRNNAQSIFHTKRGDMGGVPGTVDIVMVNPDPQRIASLVMTPQNSSSSDNSTVSNSSDNSTDSSSAPTDPFVLDASNSTQTQFYLTPAPSSNSTNTTSSLPDNNVMVTLQVPVFEPSTVSMSPFCATYDPNPSDPVPIGMRECSDDLMVPATDSTTHASQAFLYDTDTGVVSPMWYTSGGNSDQNSQEAVSKREDFEDDFADDPEFDEFVAADSVDDSSPTDSADPAGATATMTSADPEASQTDDASSTDDSSTLSTDTSGATPTDAGDASNTSTDTIAETATATASTDDPSTTASSTTSGSTPSATASTGSDGGVSPQDVTLVFTPSGPAVPMSMGNGPATSFQPLNGGNPSSSSTDQPPDDATGQSQTPISTEASATPTDTSIEATTTDDSVGTASTAMPTASSLSSSDAPTSTVDDSESTMTATATDAMTTSTDAMSMDDSFVSSSEDSFPASATGDAVTATGTAADNNAATETDGSSGASATASPTAGSLIVDSDSIEQMFNAQ